MTLLWDSWEDQTFPWNPECFGQCFPGPQRDCHPDGRGRPRGKPSPGRRGHRALSLHCALRDACRALGDGDSASLWRKSDRVSPSTKDTGFLSGHAARARPGTQGLLFPPVRVAPRAWGMQHPVPACPHSCCLPVRVRVCIHAGAAGSATLLTPRASDPPGGARCTCSESVCLHSYLTPRSEAAPGSTLRIVNALWLSSL